MDRTRTIFIGLGLGMVALIVIFTEFSPVPISIVPLAVFAATSTIFILPRRIPTVATLLLFGLMAVSVVLVYWLISMTPLALFLLAALATWRDPRLRLALILAVATVAHVVVQVTLGQDTFLTGLATVAGVAFIYSIGRLLVSERTQREKVTELLRLVEQSRQTEKESYLIAERGRIARDLHDVLAHTLSGLTIQLEGARILASQESAPSALRDAVENAHRLSRTGLQEARRAVAALRGEQLPGPDMIPVLVEEHRLSSNGSVQFVCTGKPVPLEPDANRALYRTAQEALSNVRKHAPGADVTLHLEWSDSFVRLTVANGGSVKSNSNVEAGYGLTGMAERAELLGASLEAGPHNTGYRVQLTVPIDARNQEV